MAASTSDAEKIRHQAILRPRATLSNGGQKMSSSGGSLSGRSILIVEDEPLVALDVRAAFSAAGASVLSAASCSEALRLVNTPGLSAAIVDINLGHGEDCSAVCERLSERGIPFVFFTGEVRPHILLKWPNAPVLTKLAERARIIEAVATLFPRA
jgi:CheY-like chemotaxis protein